MNRIPTNEENRLQWLEHRRWNAFLRTMGYQHTDCYKAYLEHTHGHKQMEAKLHPCLVECNMDGIHGAINDAGNVTSYISEYVNNMNVRDALAIRRYISENEPGLDYTVTVERPESLGGGSMPVFLSLDEYVFLNIA